MSIKIQDVVANTVLPLSQFSTMGTRDNPWGELYGSFATFSFPADAPANLDDYWSDSRIYIGDPTNFQGYTCGPNDHTPAAGDLLFVLPKAGNSLKQLLFTSNTIYERSGNNRRGSWGQWKKFAFEGDSVITLPYVIEPSYISLGHFITSEISSSGTSISTGLVIIKQGQLSSCAMISLDAFGEIKVVEYWNDIRLPLEGGIVYMDDSMTQGSFSLLIPSQAIGYLIILQEDEKIPFTGSGTLGHYGNEIPNYFIGNNITTLTSSNFNRWVPKLDGSGAHSSNGPWKIDTFGQVGINQQYVDKTVTGTYYPVFVTPSGETRLLNTIYASSEDGLDISLSGNTLYLKNGSLDAVNVYISGTNLWRHQLTIAGNKISLIGQPNEITANKLRESLGLSNALHFIGVATNNITDGGTEDPGIAGYASKTAGDVILGKDGNEYLWTGSIWEKLGDESSFKLKQAAKNTNNISSSATGCNIFISDIEQNEHGEINAIKKTIAPLKIGIAETPYDGSTNTVLSLDNIGAVAKTGDTMTGTLIVPNIRAYTPPSNANPGYIKMASIVFKDGATWADQSIYLRVVGRANREAEYHISFDQSKIPTLRSFKMNNQTNLKAFLHKSTDYIWDLYFQKTTAYDKIEILDCKYSSFMEEKMTLNWIGDVVSELPNGYIEPVGDALFTNTIHAQHIVPNTTNQYDLGTSSLKWKNVYGDNFYGNANSANKVNNALTINNRGKEITFDGSAQQSLVINRRCTIGRHSTNIFYADNDTSKPKTWQRFASISFGLGCIDREIVFKVSKGLESHQHSGILRAHVRSNNKDQSGNILPLSKQLIWEYANEDINPQDFILLHALNGETQEFFCELWMNLGTGSWSLYHFDVIQEHDRSISGDDNYWTLYNHNGETEDEWVYFNLDNISSGAFSQLALLKNTASKVSNKLQFYKLDSSVENGISHLADKDYNGSAAQSISLRTLAGSNTELQKYINYTGGSTTKPVYFDKGALVVGNLYAGGSKIVLNGIDKSSSEASFYAPTSAGEKDQYLKFDDSGVPVWTTTIVSNSWKDGQVAGPKLTVSVNGISSESTIPIATTGNSGVVTTDTQSFSGAKTFTNTLTLSNGKLQASTTFYLSSAENTSIIFQNGTTEAGRFNPSGCLNLGGHNSTSSTFKLNIKGNALINTSNAGWYLTDGTGYNYPGVYDNTTNLWIGAVKAASKHHTGGTMISTGYNKDTGIGNNSIQVAIPNANNDGATLRQVLHEGYIAGKSGINYGTEAQRDALTATATTGQMFFVLI